MVFAVHQYELAIGIHVSPPSCTPLPPSSPVFLFYYFFLAYIYVKLCCVKCLHFFKKREGEKKSFESLWFFSNNFQSWHLPWDCHDFGKEKEKQEENCWPPWTWLQSPSSPLSVGARSPREGLEGRGCSQWAGKPYSTQHESYWNR